jgi:hypothetical protein
MALATSRARLKWIALVLRCGVFGQHRDFQWTRLAVAAVARYMFGFFFIRQVGFKNCQSGTAVAIVLGIEAKRRTPEVTISCVRLSHTRNMRCVRWH